MNYCIFKLTINKAFNSIKKKKVLNPKYLLQDQQCGWMILSLMSFEQHFNCFWSHILTFQYSHISEFSFSGIGVKRKTRKSRKIFIFLVFSSQLYQMVLEYLFIFFVVVDNTVTLSSCFFRDFCGFRDFRVFDLALKKFWSNSFKKSSYINIWQYSTLKQKTCYKIHLKSCGIYTLLTF